MLLLHIVQFVQSKTWKTIYIFLLQNYHFTTWASCVIKGTHHSICKQHYMIVIKIVQDTFKKLLKNTLTLKYHKTLVIS